MMPISVLDLHYFHAVDRVLFGRMVNHMLRDPAECLLVFALWLWLEDNGYPNIVVRLLRLPNSFVNMVADEAVTMLNCLAPSSPVPPSISIANTVRIMHKDIPIEAIHENKFCSVISVKYFLNDVCAHIFTDILHEIVAARSGAKRFYEQLQIPGFPHPVFCDVSIMRLPLDAHFPVDSLWGWNGRARACRDRGFPATRSQVEAFFERMREGVRVEGRMVYPLTDPAAIQWLYTRLKPWIERYVRGG